MADPESRLTDTCASRPCGMSDRQVRDEAMTLFLAGHETTANALTWTWYLLSQNTEAEARLHEELDRVLNGRLPTFDSANAGLCSRWPNIQTVNQL